MNIALTTPGIAETKYVGGKGIAIVKRINSSSSLAVCEIKQGIFTGNELVDIYSKDGDKITSGNVRSIYPDEIYVTVDGVDLNVIRTGFVVFKGYTSEEIINIFAGSTYVESKYAIDHIKQQGNSLYIDNPSFEDDIPQMSWHKLSDGTTWMENLLSGWRTTNSSGVFRPNPLKYYPDGMPDGVNIAYSDGGIISQKTKHTIKGGHQYILRVRVGHRSDLPFSNYSIKLLAGNYVIGEETQLHPDYGEWLISEIKYISPIGDNKEGLPIEIRIETRGKQANYDLVELFEIPK